MNAQTVMELVRQTFMTAFWLAVPLLVVGFLVGVVVSLIQIITSMQDPSFASVPRLLAFLGTLLVFLPWMLNKLTTFTIALLGDLGRYAR